MKIKLLILSLIIFFFSNFIVAQHNIIPIPVNYKSTKTTFLLSDKVSLNHSINNTQAIEYIEQLRGFLAQYGITTIDNKSKHNAIHIRLSDNPEIGEEGYTLEVNTGMIILSANTAAGLFNGIQTLKQLIPLNIDKDKNRKIMGCTIIDYPRFKWRGLMLDVSRHFFNVDDVKSFIDKMAEYKFNVFHWHLSDDNGWRIEIKSLPKLTEIGAWRVERDVWGGAEPQPEEPKTYGGFYTQEQIKDIVKYAQNRNITIVPEIDMPGHSMALLSAYPQYSVNKEPKYVSPGNKFAEWYDNGKFKMLVENTLNPTDENVYEFIDKIFTEVAQLFPGIYIHMGGDEAYHGYWDESKEVKEFMLKHKIKDTHELQSYFVQRVEKIINSKGKKMIGWDEILEGGLADGAAVMSWRGMKGGIAAAKMNHEVVMSPTTYAYLDYMQGDKTVENKIYASLSLEKSYEFEPLPQGVDPKYILGGQGNVWTERIPNLQFAFYMTYPRAFAIAESVWSPAENKNWNNFIRRTEVHFDRFESSNTNICKAVYDPIVKVYKNEDKLMCELSNSIPNSEIYYTVNNTYPVKYGTKYSIPFEIKKGKLKLRTQTFVGDKAIGRELIIDRSILVERAK